MEKYVILFAERGWLFLLKCIYYLNFELSPYYRPLLYINALNKAIENKHNHVIKWLNYIINDVNNIEDYEFSFTVACSSGSLERVKWLLSINPNINISVNNEHPFCNACIYGHLDIAKYLYSIKPNINVSIHNEFPFRMACFNEYIDVAKWLISIKPNINVYAKNDEVFVVACHSKTNIELVEWLSKIRPYKYNFVIVNNEILCYSVNTEKDRKWHSRKTIIMASKIKPDVPNIFWKLPCELTHKISTYI
jgi:ankyrin repeat protein